MCPVLLGPSCLQYKWNGNHHPLCVQAYSALMGSTRARRTLQLQSMPSLLFSEVQESHLGCWAPGDMTGKADKPLLDPVTCYQRTLDTSIYTKGTCTEKVLIMGSDQKNGCACCVSFFSRMEVNRAGRRELVQACITTVGTMVGGRCRNFLPSVFQETERKMPCHLHRPCSLRQWSQHTHLMTL